MGEVPAFTPRGASVDFRAAAAAIPRAGEPTAGGSIDLLAVVVLVGDIEIVCGDAAMGNLPDESMLFQEMLQALPAAVYATDAAGRITFYNEAAAEMWGCRPELGKSEFCGSWKLYWPDGTPLPHDQCPMAVTLRTGLPVRGIEAVAERPDGTRVAFVPYPTPFLDASGKVVGAVNMLVDVTDRKAAELATQRLASIVAVLRRRHHQQGSRRRHHQLERRARSGSSAIRPRR